MVTAQPLWETCSSILSLSKENYFLILEMTSYSFLDHPGRLEWHWLSSSPKTQILFSTIFQRWWIFLHVMFVWMVFNPILKQGKVFLSPVLLCCHQALVFLRTGLSRKNWIKATFNTSSFSVSSVTRAFALFSCQYTFSLAFFDADVLEEALLVTLDILCQI